MKKILALLVLFLVICNAIIIAAQTSKSTITKSELQDKIKGGWAGQVIGCTFGGSTEFKFRGTMIQDYQAIPWDKQRCKWWFDNHPALYDDVFMDLTFVDVLEKEGLDASAKSHALAYANAEYDLSQANQAGRYNILRGIMPPESGNWVNNPHSEDIDFQIEADFAGLMSPGMVNVSSEICDRVGHIMNYGDGWYGGVYVAAMYSLAFTSNNVEYIVNEALKAIPQQSEFYECMSDVIGWHKIYPKDWKQTWFECQKKWSSDKGCPDGVFDGWNIDAKINSAYIIIGLLYGNGDFGKTMEISTRCGQDSDCNPASAGGILGAILGYSKIPDFWKAPAQVVEDINFKYTTMSLNSVYRIGTKHALENLQRNGAKITGEIIEMPVQPIKPVKLEIGFEGHFPKDKIASGRFLDGKTPEYDFEFEGVGFVLAGQAERISGNEEHTSKIEMHIDGKLVETSEMSTIFRIRKHEIAWKYQLPEGKHQVTVKLTNPKNEFRIRVNELTTYTSKELKNQWKTSLD